MCGSGRSSSSKRSESLRPHSSPSHRLDSGPDIEDNHVSTMTKQVLTRALILLLAYQSIGVVYGDIGTSPLYVFNSTFPEGIKERDDVLGALSLIFYTLTLIPLLKYISIVLYANDNGEGGTFALYSLICRHANLSLIPNQQMEDQTVSMYNLLTPSRKLNRAMKLKDAMERSYIAKTGLLLLTILGTSMVIGDGILTPSISVLSAVNGIQEATPNLGKEHVVMISVAILVIIFMIQRVGAAKIGFMFAPAVLLWFGLIASIGLYNILKHDAQIFHAWNPKYIYVYFERNKREGWVSLGGIVLSITGTEAMFADVGHFSVASIQIAFTLLVYPCLLLAYAGQAAYLIHHTNDVDQAFYKSVPAPLYWPMFVVALCAAIVASQAMISATFTIVKQACSFGSFPRHTFKVLLNSEMPTVSQ